jgi:long-chain acyl-CoA synthetase
VRCKRTPALRQDRGWRGGVLVADATGEEPDQLLSRAPLAQLLMDHPFGDDKAVLCTINRTVTAGQAREMARAMAETLSAAGVERGHGVAVQLPSGPELVTTMVGIWLVGAVFIPINVREPRKETERLTAAVRPAAMVTESGVEMRRDATRYGIDVAFVTWTSGTTGPPKAILQTHSGYLELLDRVLAPLRGKQADRRVDPTPNLVPVSVALNAGIYNVLFGLRADAAVVMMERFSTSEFAELVARYAIRSTVLPPAAIAMLADDPAIEDLAPLRYVRSITAPLSPLAARRFMGKFDVVVLNGYGQAEVGEVIGWTAQDAREHPDKLGAVGRPHPGVDIKIIDDGGRSSGPGEVGELLVRPPRMAAGYADGETLEDRLDDEGFVRTGDYASIDGDGFVWIEGRKTDLINRGGNKVFPDHIEEVLLLAPGVREAAVVGIPDERLGEVPVAFVVGEVGEDELTSLCREHLVPYKIPVMFRVVDSLPRNEVGKVLRQRLAEMADPV